MNAITLFFIHPTEFYERIRDGYLRIFVLFIILAYTCIYYFWGSKIGPLFDKHYSRFLFEERFFDILISPLLNLTISATLAIAIYLVSLGFRLQGRLSSILLGVFSLETISILLMVGQLCLFSVFGQIIYVHLWEVVGSLWQMVYLFIAIKTMFRLSNLKTLLTQMISLGMLVSTILFAALIRTLTGV